jgi:hypothetical protein
MKMRLVYLLIVALAVASTGGGFFWTRIIDCL